MSRHSEYVLAPDKELNILMYWMPYYVIIYRGYTLLKMVPFFWPTLYIFVCSVMEHML